MLLLSHSLISRFPPLSLKNSGSKFFNQKKCLLVRYPSKLDILSDFIKTSLLVFFFFFFFTRRGNF